MAWINQIAFNLMRDFRRRNTRIQIVDEMAIEDYRHTLSPDDIEEYEEILKFFQWLSANERDMLEMVLVEGAGIVDAGARINLDKWASYK